MWSLKKSPKQNKQNTNNKKEKLSMNIENRLVVAEGGGWGWAKDEMSEGRGTEDMKFQSKINK